ncbi:MAG: acetoacetate decarboxylase family protein [Desulfobacterales bacterium]|nr:acetoacetate decarboxylase family protein [Desulfobacterales bacterium]
MGFFKTKEELDSYYNLGVRKFFGAKMLGVLIEIKPEIIARLLPPPLTPAAASTGLIFIAEYPVTNLGPGYREAALFLTCSYQGEQGSYCLSMPIESEESRLYNGRDIFGFPKKLARIHLEKEGQHVHGWVERHGITFVNIKAKLTDSLPELPEMGANYLFKASPRIDLKPGFDGPVLLCRHKTDVEMKSLDIGSADLSLQVSDADPWAELEDPKVTMAFYLVSDNTMLPGKVLSEVDADAYLPYYFKITDFFEGK